MIRASRRSRAAASLLALAVAACTGSATPEPSPPPPATPDPAQGARSRASSARQRPPEPRPALPEPPPGPQAAPPAPAPAPASAETPVTPAAEPPARPAAAATGWRVRSDGTIGCADPGALLMVRGGDGASPRVIAQARAAGGCVTTFRVNEWALVEEQGELVRLRLTNGGGRATTLYFFRGDVAPAGSAE